MAWIVDAKPPKSLISRWNFRHDFFPRIVHLKKDAQSLAEEAKKQGGNEIRVFKKKG